MGNTIRRQPITSSIPAAPDYQFLNVLNFNGLNITDNPFTADVTTASDCLNVYVDETNTLTTRPRTELFYDLHQYEDDLYEFYGVYPLSIGYLFHYSVRRQDDQFSSPTRKLAIAYEVNNHLSFEHVDTDTHGVNPKSTKLSVFEQNDKIYILSGEGYYFITYTIMDGTVVRAEIDNVEGYVPTARVGRNKLIYNKENDTTTIDVEGTAYEPLNLLSDKYKESYFWDGVSELPHDTDTIEVLNQYYSSELFSELNETYDVWSYYPKDRLFMLKNKTSGKFGIGMLTTNNEVKVTETRIDVSFATVLPLCATTQKRLFLERSSSEIMIINVVSSQNYSSRILTHPKGDEIVNISPSGRYLVFQDLDGLYVYDMAGSELEEINISGISEDETMVGICWSDDEETVLLTSYAIDGQSSGTTYVINNFSSNKTANVIGHHSTSIEPQIIQISNDGTVGFLAVSGNHLYIYKNLKTEPTQTIKTYPTNVDSGIFINNNVALLESAQGPLYVDFDVAGDSEKIFDLGLSVGHPINAKLDDFLLGFDYSKNQSSYVFYKYTQSLEPLYIVTKKINASLRQESGIEVLRESFLKAFLTTRFNNERWFASGSRLYYTTYNDPTYIGLYNYNDLGEYDENITGFNLADDSTLIVYKDNRVHSVRYSEIGDDVYTYVYSDSPNTVGNNATGGSIVSILTEMPLQISYDGIFALRQLTNVQSSGRISELISEKINKKWLNLESKEAIKCCKTINRLYWTYFILSYPHDSHVYLLDNRTGSWYYWEFPISILNAFVKNNTTYFSDVSGKLYTLQTSDIINKYNHNKTEYYDAGEKLIEWNWKSQILPMKTINYSKKLISTTFIMTDTDETDQYGLNYKFKAFRKTASQTQETTLTNNINYIVSTTKRTLVPRYNFMQIELSNIPEDFNNNKLKLAGMAFKYVLLEGMN